MGTDKAKLELETNSTVYRKVKRAASGQLRCKVCPPHKGENASRQPKHGAKKPKYKNRRKGR